MLSATIHRQQARIRAIRTLIQSVDAIDHRGTADVVHLQPRCYGHLKLYT